MKNLIRFYLSIVFIFSAISIADDYADDAAEVDFYVPGILANDSMQQVNFLLCFMEKTNFSTFVDKGFYKALVDEAKCETASGADAASESASATGGSAAGGGGGAGTANTVEEVEYTEGIYQNITSGNTKTGKAWIDLFIEVDQGNAELPVLGYVETTISADKSATNKFGTFTMNYDLRNKAVLAPFFPVVNSPIITGYLKVDGSTIEYREESLFDAPRSIKADLSDSNNQQGYIQSNVEIETNTEDRIFAVRHKIFVNEGASIYCQIFDGATEYTRVSGVLTANPSPTDAATLQAIIDDAESNQRWVSSDGGTSGTITGEHCWNTKKSAAQRIVYEYGTYKNTDGSRISLTNPSMSLTARQGTDNSGLSKTIYAHAGYWGSHVNKSDRALVSDSIVFKNDRDDNDTASYYLKEHYYEITKKQKATLALSELDGVSFQLYVEGFKSNTTLLNGLGNLAGGNFPVAGQCTPPASGNPAADNCPEYSGVISVDGTTESFKVTHGMNWGATPEPIPPFPLNNPVTFTAAEWFANMVQGSYGERMHFWDPDSHQSYTAPYGAFNDTVGISDINKVRTTIRSKISIETLATDLGSDPLVCIRECIGRTEMNTAIGLAFTDMAQTNPSPGVVNASPYKAVGPYFWEDGYEDNNGINGQEVGEADVDKGRHNNIGGVRWIDATDNDAAIYTISDGKLREGTAGSNFLEYTGDNINLVKARDHDDTLRLYQYYTKPDNTYSENWRQNFGWAFHMTAFKGSTTNIDDIKCDTDGGNARGYDQKWTKKSNSNRFHVTGDNYLCDYKLWEGGIDVTYDINVKQMPDYRLYKGNDLFEVSAPETVLFTVPSENVEYNFENTNLAGQKFKLKFEGFGELHRIPGRVVDTCTGEVYGRYVNEWKQCYRYVHEFVIPEGTVLTNLSGGSDIKVRPLRGDEYLKKLITLPTRSYTASASDLPTESVLKNLFSGADALGDPSSSAADYVDFEKPAVIHGETVITPQ